MRVLFGVVSLLVVLAGVDFIATRQLASMATGRADALADRSAAWPLPAASGTARDSAQQIQDQVRDGLNRALQLGEARRQEAADK